jgi:DNA-binding transcriptional LysR family regulator
VKLRQFEALRQVIARGTTKDAAVAMGLTQSAVSRLVRQLEDEFGFMVFDRRQGRLHLTPEGQRFYAEVEKILGGLDQLQSMAKDLSTLSVGTLRLIAMPALGFGLLPAAVETIQARYKRLKISIDLANRQTVEQGLLEASHDLGLVTLPIENRSLDVEPLCSIDCVAVLPKGHPLAERAAIEAHDLEGEAFISIEPGTLFRYRTDELFGGLGVRRELRLEAQSTVMVCSLVAQGLGVSLVHRFIAEAFSGRLEIKPFAPAIAFEYGLAFPAAHSLSKVAAEFVETLRATASALATGEGSSPLTATPAAGARRGVPAHSPPQSAAGSRLSGSGIG